MPGSLAATAQSSAGRYPTDTFRPCCTSGGTGPCCVHAPAPGRLQDCRARIGLQSVEHHVGTEIPGPFELADPHVHRHDQRSAHEPGEFHRVQSGTDGVQQALKPPKGGQNEAKIGTGFTVITTSNIDNPEGTAAAYKASC